MSIFFLRATPRLLFTVAFLLTACESSSFSGGSKSARGNAINQAAAEGGDGSAETSAAEGGDTASGQPIRQEFVGKDDTGDPAVDVVIPFDTSLSMVSEAKYLSDNMKPFLTKLVNNNVDARVTVIAKPIDYGMPAPGPFGGPMGGFGKVELSFPTDLPTDRFVVYDAVAVDSHNAIGVLNTFFATNANPLPQRKDVRLELVIITDDNGEGSGNLAVDFKTPAGKSVTVNSIIGLKAGEDPNNPDCDIPNVGEEYKTLSKQTKGTIFDLCRTDWDKLLGELSDAIINRSTENFILKAEPDLTKGFKVFLNGKPVATEQYELNVESKTIRFTFDLTGTDKVVVEYFAKRSE